MRTSKQHRSLSRAECMARHYVRYQKAESCISSTRGCEALERRTRTPKAIRNAAFAFLPVKKKLIVCLNHPALQNARESEFDRLATEWRRDTGKLSMLHKIVLHPAYQRIIGMGEQVLPLIFKELDTRGGHWIWALSAITGKCGVAKPGDTFREAVQAWLKWGRDNGYL